MKKKFVVALVAAMSLTVAGTGTVFAMDKVSTIASEKEHVHGCVGGCYVFDCCRNGNSICDG